VQTIADKISNDLLPFLRFKFIFLLLDFSSLFSVYSQVITVKRVELPDKLLVKVRVAATCIFNKNWLEDVILDCV